MYDIAIIGAGINGCSVAYEFEKIGKKVVIFDTTSIAGGGSGAAGAFISPKFSKAGELKELINDAFVYSKEFYINNFPSCVINAPLLHIAQDKESSKILKFYKSTTDINLKTPLDELLNSLNPDTKNEEKIYIDACVVDAQKVCNNMLKSTKFINKKVEKLIYNNGVWKINNIYNAKNVVLATGAYENILKEEYIKLRGVWGHRIDVKSSTKNSNSIHQFVSISPSKNGIISIGATHNVHYHPNSSKEAYNIQEGREELLKKSTKTLKLDNITVVKDYMGLRSGSFDYLPLLGKIVNSKKTLACKDINFKVKKADFNKYTYYPNLFMINGSGGYGFVLAPYLALMLKEHILKDKDIDKRVNPARFFARWAKKLT